MLDRLALFGLTNAALATLLTAVLWLAYRRIKAPHVVRLLAIVVCIQRMPPDTDGDRMWLHRINQFGG